MNLAALLFDVARRVPRQLAVSDNRQSLSYSELAERITRLAGGLRAYGLAPGDRVLLVLENCSEFFELLFAWTLLHGSVVRRRGSDGVSGPRF